MRRIIRSGVNIDKLAHKLATTKSTKIKYKEGSPEDKVWINFQSNKKQKREFNSYCNTNQINASGFLRHCVSVLIESGSVGSAFKKIKGKIANQEKVENES